MSTTTIERTEVIAPAKPLTASELDSLITLAASTEKPKRVRSSGSRSVREVRAWSLGGNVD